MASLLCTDGEFTVRNASFVIKSTCFHQTESNHIIVVDMLCFPLAPNVCGEGPAWFTRSFISSSSQPPSSIAYEAETKLLTSKENMRALL